MLDFRQTSRRRNRVAPKRHRQWLVLLFFLGIVLIAAEQSQDPNLWRWFNQLSEDSENHFARSTEDSADNPPEGGAAGNAGHRQPLEHAARAAEGFSSLYDDTPSSIEEQGLFLHLFGILEKTTVAEICRQSIGRVDAGRLFSNPDRYRGRLVIVSGVVRRIDQVKIPANDRGVTEYRQLWLFSKKSPAMPVVICCLAVPEGFPAGTPLAESVVATGFFVKRWAYQAKDGVRSAPLLVARTVDWRRSQPAVPKVPVSPSPWTILGIVVSAALLALLGTWYAYHRTTFNRRSIVPEAPPDFEALRQQHERPEERPDERPQSPANAGTTGEPS